MTAIEKSETAESTETRDAAVSDAVGKAVKGLVGVGRLWAAYGLDIGRSALETSAATLRTTAALLGEISQRLPPRDEDEAKPDAA